MVQEYEIVGYEDFKEQIVKIKSKESGSKKSRVFVLFSGSRTEDGTNWCPDCEKAEPVVKEALKKLNNEDAFVHVEVGTRTYWKDPKCPFRTDKDTLLTSVPTLVLWGGLQRLEEDECADPSLLEMLFNECR